MDYVATYYSMTADKLSNEIMNLHKKLSKINSQSPMYNQVLDLIQAAEAINREKMMMAKFTEEEVSNIRNVLINKMLCSEIAKMYNVDYKTIDNMLKRKTWKHI